MTDAYTNSIIKVHYIGIERTHCNGIQQTHTCCSRPSTSNNRHLQSCHNRCDHFYRCFILINNETFSFTVIMDPSSKVENFSYTKLLPKLILHCILAPPSPFSPPPWINKLFMLSKGENKQFPFIMAIENV